jgi:hypothetical protein
MAKTEKATRENRRRHDGSPPPWTLAARVQPPQLPRPVASVAPRVNERRRRGGGDEDWSELIGEWFDLGFHPGKRGAKEGDDQPRAPVLLTAGPHPFLAPHVIESFESSASE